MKALMRELETRDFIEVVDVKSGPHRMMFDGERYRPAGDSAKAVECYAVRRDDGTPWLLPADMIQFID